MVPTWMQETIKLANASRLSGGTISLTFKTTTTLGERTIGITDTTPDDDRPNASAPLGFKIYVIPTLDTETELRLRYKYSHEQSPDRD